MASIARRRNRDGSSSWDTTVRIVGYPTQCQSFPTKLEANLWASRMEAAARGRTLALARDMALAQLIDEGTFDRVARATELARNLSDSHAPPGHDSDLHCLLLGKHPRRPKGAMIAQMGQFYFDAVGQYYSAATIKRLFCT